MRAVLVALLVVSAGCRCRGGDSEPASRPIQSDARMAREPAPRPLNAAERVDRVRACAGPFDARDAEALAGCYAPAATATLVGGTVTASSAEQVVEQLARALWTGFPDLKVEPQLIAAAGTAQVSVDLLTGTNRGALLGQPATQKPVGLLAARLLQLAPTGEIVDEQLFVDEASLRGQLGDPGLAVRPLLAHGLGEPRVVVAAGDSAEQQAAAVLGRIDVAFNDHALAPLIDGFADDGVLADQTLAADVRGKAAIGEQYGRLFRAFPDLHTTRIALWAARGFAVQVVDVVGTNDGPWPELGIRRPTGRTVRFRQLQVAELRGGKIGHLQAFANGLSLRIQLGLLPDPSTAAPPEDEDEAP